VDSDTWFGRWSKLIFNISLTCKTFRELIRKQPKAWSRIALFADRKPERFILQLQNLSSSSDIEIALDVWVRPVWCPPSSAITEDRSSQRMRHLLDTLTINYASIYARCTRIRIVGTNGHWSTYLLPLCQSLSLPDALRSLVVRRFPGGGTVPALQFQRSPPLEKLQELGVRQLDLGDWRPSSTTSLSTPPMQLTAPRSNLQILEVGSWHLGFEPLTFYQYVAQASDTLRELRLKWWLDSPPVEDAKPLVLSCLDLLVIDRLSGQPLKVLADTITAPNLRRIELRNLSNESNAVATLARLLCTGITGLAIRELAFVATALSWRSGIDRELSVLLQDLPNLDTLEFTFGATRLEESRITEVERILTDATINPNLQRVLINLICRGSIDVDGSNKPASNTGEGSNSSNGLGSWPSGWTSDLARQELAADQSLLRRSPALSSEPEYSSLSSSAMRTPSLISDTSSLQPWSIPASQPRRSSNLSRAWSASDEPQESHHVSTSPVASIIRAAVESYAVEHEVEKRFEDIMEHVTAVRGPGFRTVVQRVNWGGGWWHEWDEIEFH